MYVRIFTQVHTAFWRIVWLHDDFHVNLTEFFFCQMGPLLGVDPGLPFGLYFFPLTSEQLSIIYIKCQEHISEQFLFLLLSCFC